MSFGNRFAKTNFIMAKTEALAVLQQHYNNVLLVLIANFI